MSLINRKENIVRIPGGDGTLIYVVRRDIDASIVDANDKFSPLVLDDEGNLKVSSRRENAEFTLYASVARIADPTANDQDNKLSAGLLVIIDVTDITLTPIVTPSIKVKDPVSGKYVTIWTAAATIVGVGTTSYLFHVGLLAADFPGTEAKQIPIPKTWKLDMAHTDADSITYSVGGIYLK